MAKKSRRGEHLRQFDIKEVEIFSKTGVVVRDKEQKKLYEKLSKHPILKKQKWRASDGEVYNLATRNDIFKQKIAHLPSDEQTQIAKAKKLYSKTILAKNVAMKKAYGKRVTKTDGTEVRWKTGLDKYREELIELFGRMFSVAEIHEIALTKFKIKAITKDMVKSFRKSHAAEIEDKIKKFKEEYTDMRLAIKRGRLEELVQIYSIGKRRYIVSNKNDDHRVLLATLEQIRKEAEGDKLRIETSLDGQGVLDALFQAQVNREVEEFKNIKEIVLARVAAKSNVPVRIFLGQVEKSWYNSIFKQEGEINVEDIDFEEIDKPTDQNYDFNKIKKIHKQKRINDEIANENAEKVDKKKVKKGATLKAKLLATLASKQREVRFANNTLKGNASFEPE